MSEGKFTPTLALLDNINCPSPQELEIFTQWLNGDKPDEIADKIGIKKHQAQIYQSRAFKKIRNLNEELLKAIPNYPHKISTAQPEAILNLLISSGYFSQSEPAPKI